MEEKKSKNIVILAAGDFPSHPIPQKALQEADFVVCCDSAYEAIRDKELEIRNYIVIGDGDSLSEQDKCQLGDRWIHVPEQDYNDLHKAMSWAARRFQDSSFKFQILGATGKREDHTLGNISYLVTFAEEHPGADIVMLTNHGRFLAFRGERTFDSFPRQQVSLLIPDSTTAVTSDGLRWPLDNFHARLWWNATLNEALKENFTLRTTGWILLFQTYETKG